MGISQLHGESHNWKRCACSLFSCKPSLLYPSFRHWGEETRHFHYKWLWGSNDTHIVEPIVCRESMSCHSKRKHPRDLIIFQGELEVFFVLSKVRTEMEWDCKYSERERKVCLERMRRTLFLSPLLRPPLPPFSLSFFRIEHLKRIKDEMETRSESDRKEVQSKSGGAEIMRQILYATSLSSWFSFSFDRKKGRGDRKSFRRFSLWKGKIKASEGGREKEAVYPDLISEEGE